jgi:uridine kinase
MLLVAEHDFNIEKEDSFIIGDTTTDIQTGINYGIQTILVKTGYAGSDKKFNCIPDFVFENLKEAIDFIVDDYERLLAALNEMISFVPQKSKECFVFSIGGLSRSGKSTIAKIMFIALKNKGVRARILGLDNWIVDLNNREAWMGVRERYDYNRIQKDVRSFLAGNEILVNKYDARSRLKSELTETIKLDTYEAVIIDGVIALDIPYLREVSDLKIYIDINEQSQNKRFYEFYRYKGLSRDEITELYLQRQLDEVPIVVQTRTYADRILAV